MGSRLKALQVMNRQRIARQTVWDETLDVTSTPTAWQTPPDQLREWVGQTKGYPKGTVDLMGIAQAAEIPAEEMGKILAGVEERHTARKHRRYTDPTQPPPATIQLSPEATYDLLAHALIRATGAPTNPKRNAFKRYRDRFQSSKDRFAPQKGDWNHIDPAVPAPVRLEMAGKSIPEAGWRTDPWPMDLRVAGLSSTGSALVNDPRVDAHWGRTWATGAGPMGVTEAYREHHQRAWSPMMTMYDEASQARSRARRERLAREAQQRDNDVQPSAMQAAAQKASTRRRTGEVLDEGSAFAGAARSADREELVGSFGWRFRHFRRGKYGVHKVSTHRVRRQKRASRA